MKKFIFGIALVIFALAIGFGQEVKKTDKATDKDSISDADKKVLTDLIEKLKSDENDEEKTLNEVIELYKRIGNLLIDKLNELRKTDEEIVSKISTKITSYQKAECEKLRTVFDLFPMPDLKGRKFV
ncbi:MAG: hypothetical protein KAR20_14675, partial [Candidatus Heimdallarchaeota archaeon]|nr:hypothetical protein [Candidatus Heimdallarchaeota archaeon]